ncbi:MAG: hypothetical protein ACOY3D_03845 [Candidatus Omnitrophota bacterium]
MYRKHQRSAQSTLEYAVLIVLVAVAVIATQTYIKRAMQGRLRSSADDVGEQFSPGASNVLTTITSNSVTQEDSNRTGSMSTIISDNTVRTTNMTVEGFNSTNEYWATCGDGRCCPPETEATCGADCPGAC